jgi:hypothetical protein
MRTVATAADGLPCQLEPEPVSKRGPEEVRQTNETAHPGVDGMMQSRTPGSRDRGFCSFGEWMLVLGPVRVQLI